jgi:hypothetical protein
LGGLKMKAILEFDLPEDNCNHILAVHAMDFALLAWDLDQYLREKLKYGHQFTDADDALEAIREFLHDQLIDRQISLDMIE